jgi:extracellular factor (EF) 3-hydroxypalmitic acid methyl ester biosynthesis protein
MLAAEYRESLDDILNDARTFGPNDPAMLRQMELATSRLLVAKARDAEANASKEELEILKKQTQELLRPLWERGLFGHEISHWPSGPGSARAMELIYENRPLEHSVETHYTEWFLLTRDLAHAVRSRRTVLRELLVGEIQKRAGAMRILDLACGPCQSLREALPIIADPKRIALRAVDTDAVMQTHNAEYFNQAQGMPWTFETANALRIDLGAGVNDVVYSTGLYDYLANGTLTSLWKKVYASLAPGGAALLSVKDGSRFCPIFYRWAIPWHQFNIRREPEFVEIMRRAELPEPESVRRDATGCIIFYTIRKPA